MRHGQFLRGRKTALKSEFFVNSGWMEQVVCGKDRVWRSKVNRLVWGGISFVQNFDVRAWEPWQFLGHTERALRRVYSASCLTECSR